MSIKEIANSVGVSSSTVSRVLNNPEYRCAEPKLRDKIWKKAMEQILKMEEKPKEEMGKFAMYLLVDRMNGGHKASTKMELEGKLMIRNSCSSVQESMWSDYSI